MIASLTCRDTVVLGKPPTIYDAHGRTLHARHSAPTPQVMTGAAVRAVKARRKAQRLARRAAR